MCRDTLQLNPPVPSFFHSGCYDWCIIRPEDRSVITKGRTIVFPSSTSSNQFYEVNNPSMIDCFMIIPSLYRFQLIWKSFSDLKRSPLQSIVSQLSLFLPL